MQPPSKRKHKTYLQKHDYTQTPVPAAHAHQALRKLRRPSPQGTSTGRRPAVRALKGSHDTRTTTRGAERAESPTHRAFAAHLMKVSEALRAMEWMLSCDTSPGSEVAAIRAVLSEGAELEAATERAREALAELQSALSANA